MFSGPKSGPKSFPKFKHARSSSTPSYTSCSQQSLSDDSQHRCQIYEIYTQVKKAIHEWCTQVRKTTRSWIRTIISTFITISWINRAVCAFTCNKDRIVHRYRDLRIELSRFAASICDRIGPSKRALFIALGLSSAVIFFVLLWTLIVFDVPHGPSLYILALIFGKLKT